MNRWSRVAQALFVLNGAVWLGFGIFTLTGMAARYPDQMVTIWVVGLLMFGNTAAMLMSAFGLGKPQRRFYYFALAVLLVNILLTFTDQFGIFDLLTLLLDLLLLVLLFSLRRLYSPSGRE